jgi:formate dehydrogenase major subunit
VPSLGATFGRGAATTYQQDLENSDCILIMGSNMAEAHPVGFRWPMKAKAKGAKLIHVDPRFTRTSALADTYVPIRAGTDIAFLGGLINYVLTHDRWFKEYVVAFTNASSIIEDGFLDAEDLGGIFSGLDPEKEAYDTAKGRWGYKDSASAEKANVGEEGGGEGQQKHEPDSKGMHGHGLMGGASAHTSKRSSSTVSADHATPKDPTLQDPRCVFQMLKRHFERYTPEMVGEVCGCAPSDFEKVAEMLCDNSGRERTSAICYAVGWTQHTTGVQIIRAASILQLLLGNMGRPGGGILALRGHASIQGSTDIPTLYDLLPGYLPQPIATENHETIDKFVDVEGLPTGYWVNFRKFLVSLLKAYYGEAASADNEYGFTRLPRVDADYSMVPYADMMSKGKVKGYFIFGQNPAAGMSNGRLVRQGLRNLDWLVVADWFETESAVFWKNDPNGPPPEEVKTEVFFIPAAPAPCKEGTLTNTQRLIQWHDKALDPDGDCRSDLWFVYNLGKRLKALYADSTDPRDRPLQALTWDYDFEEPPRLPDGSLSIIADEPDAARVLQEINGWSLAETDPKTGKPKLLQAFAECKDDGTTACGCWIYTGVFPNYDRNRARERNITDNPLQPDWAYAWPMNRRILYNRASADPEGKPWSERKKLIWWDEAHQKWVGPDVPDFEPEKPPSYRPADDAKGMDAIAGDNPFIMKSDGKGWLFAPGGVKDAPFPTHYEPVESPVRNRIYPQHQVAPTNRYFPGPGNAIAHTPGDPEYPIVACTFRVTEQYLSGPMSRFNSWLNELMPEMFVELSPELAEERGITHGDYLVVTSARASIEARALVTRRIRPMNVQGGIVHQIGIPFQWGYAGETVGGSVNDLIPFVAEPNVSMHETKVFTCNIHAGRLPGPPLQPTKPPARWSDRRPTPDTSSAAQPEGHLLERRDDTRV